MGEINKTVSVSVQATAALNIKWILADTEPVIPTDYGRFTSLDIDLGQLGKLWAYKKTA